VLGQLSIAGLLVTETDPRPYSTIITPISPSIHVFEGGLLTEIHNSSQSK